MTRYILKRTALMIPVILGISLLIFAILEFSPGDPATIILGDRAPQESIDALREQMGLNRPFFIRYADFLADALRGDLGVSYRTKLPVFDEIMARLPTTLILAVGAIVLMVLVGLPIGVLSAVKQYSLVDGVTLAGALILTSMPGFWLGTVLILVFALSLGWLPATGGSSFSGFILPWVTLAASQIASLIRMTRSNMLEVIRADYIKMARAKGAPEKTVIVRHALRNALMPIVTIIGLNFSALLGGTMIIESVFALPGLGTLAVISVRQKDIPMVMAEVLFIALIGGLINLLVDVLYVYIDPRLKSQYVRPVGGRRGAH
ncbi:MAG: ABC transporter permease [Oscillospiraceae bacterium]|nr:ABC transporter permease [Oscillospiraceae bacterium]